MNLSAAEQRILDGEEGEGARKALELVIALGKIYGAEDLVPITSAHLSGVSYKTIGDGGITYLEHVSKESRVRVPSTLNPSGMDSVRWREMGVSEEFAAKQLHIIGLYGSMGVETSCSCTPYLAGNIPNKGDHVAWAESSALSMVNSMVGARTNREGGPGALAAAIVGRTANYGLHLTVNRAPTVVIEAEIDDDLFSHSLLGQAVGSRIGNGIPYFRGIQPDWEEAKIMAAAMAASGAVAMFHVEDHTPEASEHSIEGLEVIRLTNDDLRDAQESLSTVDDVELIAFGCPHLSRREVKEMATYLKDKEKRTDIPIWFCTSREVRDSLPAEVAILERFGTVLADTCMVVTPVEGMYSRTASDSAKACNYLPTLCSQKVHCDSFQRLMEVVL